jgi:hypothetical protein
MMSAMRITLIALSIAIAVGSCSKPADNTPELTSVEKLAAGWDHFEAGEIADAKDMFHEIKSDEGLGGEALSGLAWCSNALSHPDSAQFYVDLAMNAGYTEYDMLLLLSAVQLAEGSFTEAITTLDGLVISSTWVFEHNSDVGYLDYVLILGYSNYHLGNFAETISNIQLLDASVSIDPADDDTWSYRDNEYSELGVLLLAILNDFSGVLVAG